MVGMIVESRVLYLSVPGNVLSMDVCDNTPRYMNRALLFPCVVNHHSQSHHQPTSTNSFLHRETFPNPIKHQLLLLGLLALWPAPNHVSCRIGNSEELGGSGGAGAGIISE